MQIQSASLYVRFAKRPVPRHLKIAPCSDMTPLGFPVDPEVKRHMAASFS